MNHGMWVYGWAPEDGNSPQMKTSNKMEISALQLQGTIYTTNIMNEQEPSTKKPSPAKTLTLAVWDMCQMFFPPFIFREGKGGIKRGRETSICGCLLHAPTGDPTYNPGM